MKKWGGWEQNDNHPHHEKVTGNNTSRIIKENNYYIYTYREEENLPIVREILKKYSELGLPPYEYPPEKSLWRIRSKESIQSFRDNVKI